MIAVDNFSAAKAKIFFLTEDFVISLVEAIIDCDSKLRKALDTLSDKERAALISESVLAELNKRKGEGQI